MTILVTGAAVPPSFAHGFMVTSESADFLYKTTDYYAPEHERCVAWDDPTIGIDRPLAQNGIDNPLLSAKDRRGLSLSKANGGGAAALSGRNSP